MYFLKDCFNYKNEWVDFLVKRKFLKVLASFGYILLNFLEEVCCRVIGSLIERILRREDIVSFYVFLDG